MDFLGRIVLNHGLTVNHLGFQSCCIAQCSNEKSFLFTNLFCISLAKFTCVLTWTIIKLEK